MIERDLGQADAMLMEAGALASRNQVTHYSIPAAVGMLRFHENRVDEAEEALQEARTLCKSAGDRVNEYQANEYLAMLFLQQGRLDDARGRCAELLALGRKLREGSEEPFARAMLGLCRYIADDDPAELDAALPDLRVADAKHRLAYVLTRSAVVDCQRGRRESGLARATEALGYAELLERATEMLIANAVLAHCHSAAGKGRIAAKHRKEVERLGMAGAAAWTAGIAACLDEDQMQKPDRRSG
jgi:hypothetical protein